LAASKTYTYPQFKEVSPFLYENPNYNEFGNPELRPAENVNVDLKFEHYFVGDGLIAISGFYKRINESINRILVNSAALEYSFVNTGDANVMGAEVEFRRKLVNLSKLKSNTYLSSGVNVSYLHADQSVENDPTSKVQFIPTSDHTGLEGASPLLINADITFNKISNKGNKITSALVLNYFSDRIAALGTAGQQNIIEKGIPTLDLISRIEVSRRLNINVSFRNLLNPEYQLTKEIGNTGVNDLILTYKKGITSSIEIAYRF
jgi:outer membrane receptor protein involved in Fe transport